MKSSDIPAELFFESESIKKMTHTIKLSSLATLSSLEDHLEGIYRELKPHTLLVLAVLTDGPTTRGKRKRQEVTLTFLTSTQSKVFESTKKKQLQLCYTIHNSMVTLLSKIQRTRRNFTVLSNSFYWNKRWHWKWEAKPLVLPSSGTRSIVSIS